MKIWLKRVLISLVVVLIVALVSIAIFLLTFDPNAYKSKLEEIVYSRYHRTLAIKGDIQLSLFPRIGLSVTDVSLSDRDSTDLFASIASARFAVAIWPLLSNRLVVDHVAVTGFKAWLVRDQHGVFNFSDLAGYSPPPAQGSDSQPVSLPTAALSRALHAPEPAADPAADDAKDKPSGLSKLLGGPAAAKADLRIDIAGLELRNGEIHLRDTVSGSDFRIVNLDVNTGRVTFDQAFDVAVKGNILGSQPQADATLDAQAIVKLDPVGRNYSAQRLNLQVNGVLGQLLAKSITLRGNLAYSAYSQMLSASNLEVLLQGDVNQEPPITGLESSLTVSQLKVDRSQAQLQLEKLAFRAKGSQPGQRFEAALDAPAIAVSPERAQGDAVTGTLKITDDTSVLGASMGLAGLGGNASQLTFRELKFDGALKQGSRLSQLNMVSPATWKLFEKTGGLSAIKGDVRVEDAALPEGVFQFPFIGSLHADLFKDQLSSDINAVLNGGKISFGLKAKDLANPKVEFDLSADKLDLTSLLPSAAAVHESVVEKASAPEPAVAEKAPTAVVTSAPVDLRFLDAMDIRGKVSIDELVHKDFNATQFSANVLAAEGTLDISQIKAALYQGSLAAHFVADSKNLIQADVTLDGVDLGPLLLAVANENRLLGHGSVKAKLKTQGSTVAALKAGLSGTLDLGLRNGAVRGINLAQTLREAHAAVRNMFSGQLPDVMAKLDMARQTDFSSLDAKVDFANGQGTVKKLALMAPLLRVSQGVPATIDLVNEQLDLLVNVKVVNTKTGQEGKDLADLKGITFPVRISGPFASLGYQLQWKDIGSRAIKDAVKDGLLDMLSQQAAKEPDQKQAVPDETQKTDRVKSIGDAIKGLLGQ